MTRTLSGCATEPREKAPHCSAINSSRRRLLCALWMAALLGAGLLWREPTLHLSQFMSKYGGDALWAAFVFAGLAFLFPRLSTGGVAAAAMGFSLLIELSQLYHAPWIDAVRGTRLGALALGASFNPPDLIAYAVGIGLAAVTEHIGRRIRWP